jgi:uncharacterized protein (TIGR03067 family)
MKVRSKLWLVVIGLGLVLPARGGDEMVEGDLARLQGRWTTSAGPRRNIHVVLDIQGHKATVGITTPQGVKLQVRGELRLNDRVTPRALDWVRFSGLDEQELPNIAAIYELDGPTFKVCNGGPNNARPTEFKPGENLLADVHVFQRAKPTSE